MTERSLKASSEGIKSAKLALIEKFSTQQKLADVLEITRQPVSKFFNGKSVDSSIFVRICEKLGLDWKEVSTSSEIFNKSLLLQDDELDALLFQVREKLKPRIQEQCGLMRVLDMTQPIGICDIYTDVNILETVVGRRWLGFEELLKDFDPDVEDFDRRGLGKVSEKRVAGPDVVNRYPKLMVLGKPGAGKSTFLKYLAIQCISEDFQLGRIPIFITLKEFAEAKGTPDLFTFINQSFSIYSVEASQLRMLLGHGRFLILLDGLDEVREEDNDRVIKQIQSFSEQFFFSDEFKVDQSASMSERKKRLSAIEHIRSKKNTEADKYKATDLDKFKELYDKAKAEFDSSKKKIEKETPDLLREFDQGLTFLSRKNPGKYYNNHFVVTCRIAAREYVFQNFVEVEVADFDEKQIRTFSKNWFNLKDPTKGKKFIRKLLENQPLRELANSPLLLTLLCLVFEESADFPTNRSELYKEGVSILLKKWDAQRNIERDQVYKNLSVPRKEDLLSLISFHTFDRKEYFFRQRDIESLIAKYIRNLPDARVDTKALQLDSEVVLKSVEAQHGLLVERARGIYSFSHLTFQEYFTARKIITNSEPQELEKALSNLACRITEKRWREVLLLALGMLPSAERLFRLLQHKVSGILSEDKKLQNFLLWVYSRSLSYSSYRPEALRCIYFVIGCDLTSDLPKHRLHNFALEPDLGRAFDMLHLLDDQLIKDISSGNSVTNEIVRDFVISRDLSRGLSRDLARSLLTMRGFKNKNSKVLKPVLTELPDFTRSRDVVDAWWSDNGEAWTNLLKSFMVEHYNIGQDWDFSLRQRSLLKEYYYASKMLLECLNSDCYVQRETRQEIRESLFMPISD